MAYTVLARRYRSATFDEIIGQEHIAQTLKKAIESERIAHAYLFCGTRGTGKTSTAHILAKALNCRKSDAPTPEPCGKCDSCLAIAAGEDMDVIEIDAASNTGVDNVREIIENSQYRPARSRFKIYIIDEVHMLSKNAFNALLKTLEEPPSHVKFILATTEPEKVLPTILSRCQRYDFRNIPTREIAGHLKNICKKEKITADEDALALVAKAGAGSMRDALSLLDRLLSIGEKRLTTATIEQMLGLPRAQLVFDLAQSIGQGDVKQTLSQADAMITGGLSADALIAALVDHLRNLLIARTCGTESGLVDVPGLAIADLAAQAEQFDSIALAQDITILEELRRNLRQNQTGRALLDATLVRLALSGQFASIADLLAGMNGSPGTGSSAAQKKKPEPVKVVTVTTFAPAAMSHATAAAIGIPAEKIGSPISAPADDDDNDDDLPRPGKVWTGPSLAEMMRQQAASSNSSTSVAVAMPAASNPPASEAGDEDVIHLWPRLLANLEGQGSPLAGVLGLARLDRIDDGVAIIRFRPDQGTFATQWAGNGKKDSIARALSDLRGRPIGVRFEIDDASAAMATAVTKPPQAKSSGFSQAAPKREIPENVSEPAAPLPQRPSQEMLEEVQLDPLVQAVLREFGGTILKVE